MFSYLPQNDWNYLMQYVSYMVQSQSKLNHPFLFLGAWSQNAQKNIAIKIKLARSMWFVRSRYIAPDPSLKGRTTVLDRAQEACSFLHACALGDWECPLMEFQMLFIEQSNSFGPYETSYKSPAPIYVKLNQCSHSLHSPGS